MNKMPLEEIKRYNFDRDFGSLSKKTNKIASFPNVLEKKGSDKEQETPETKVLSWEDVENARLEGIEEGRVLGKEESKKEYYDVGFLAGEKKAQETIEEGLNSQFSKLLEGMEVSLNELIEQRKKDFEQIGDYVLLVSMSVLKKILPKYVERFGYDEIKQQFLSVTPQLVEEERIEVIISSVYGDERKKMLEDLFDNSGLSGRFKIHYRDNMGPSDVKITWRGGKLERDMDKIINSIESLMGSVEG